VYLEIEGGVINDISFEGSGCAISKSSASMMTTVLKGKTPAEAETLFEAFHTMVTSDTDTDPGTEETLGKLAVFSGVREFPIRVKCATLAWHTVHAALNTSGEPVTTE
jgi:nitrogen fixation NifU-like protein